LRDRKETKIMFKGQWEQRRSKIEAYRRLLQRFLIDRPDIPNNPYEWPHIAEGRTRWYIGKTLADLFPTTPHLTHRARKVTIEWYINTDIDETIMLTVLRRFARAASYRLDEDWDWDSGKPWKPSTDMAVDI
jgi:hypothetical protein